MALLSVHTQSYDVLQKADLRGTVELEPRNLTEVKLGWKLLIAASHSQLRRTVNMSKDTLFFSRFLFGDVFGQTQAKTQMQIIIKKENKFFADFQPFYIEQK